MCLYAPNGRNTGFLFVCLLIDTEWTVYWRKDSHHST